MNICAHCHGNINEIHTYHAEGGEGPLCDACGARDITQWISELDEFDRATLNKRILEWIKSKEVDKSYIYKNLILHLILREEIDYEDLI